MPACLYVYHVCLGDHRHWRRAEKEEGWHTAHFLSFLYSLQDCSLWGLIPGISGCPQLKFPLRACPSRSALGVSPRQSQSCLTLEINHRKYLFVSFPLKIMLMTVMLHVIPSLLLWYHPDCMNICPFSSALLKDTWVLCAKSCCRDYCKRLGHKYIFSLEGTKLKRGLVAHACNSSTQEAEAGGL